MLIYVFGLVFPANVVLGNWRFNPIESAIYSGFCVTFFVWVFWDYAIAKGIKLDGAMSKWGYFWLSNVLAFWLVSRFSQIAGFGISSFLWVMAVGLGAYVVQRMAWKLVVRRG